MSAVDDAALEAFLDDLYQSGVDTAPELHDALRRAGYRIVVAAAWEEWRNHMPSGYTDQAGYGQVYCSCGWDSSGVLGWEQHINAVAVS